MLRGSEVERYLHAALPGVTNRQKSASQSRDSMRHYRLPPWRERANRGATFTFAADDDALHQGLLELRRKIDHRRSEHKLRIKERVWNPDGVVKMELIRLLDWIEDERLFFQ